MSFTSFLESASHTKAATAIPALLCTIAALKEKKTCTELSTRGRLFSTEKTTGKNGIHFGAMVRDVT